jgi:hypothetical protein
LPATDGGGKAGAECPDQQARGTSRETPAPTHFAPHQLSLVPRISSSAICAWTSRIRLSAWAWVMPVLSAQSVACQIGPVDIRHVLPAIGQDAEGFATDSSPVESVAPGPRHRESPGTFLAKQHIRQIGRSRRWHSSSTWSLTHLLRRQRRRSQESPRQRPHLTRAVPPMRAEEAETRKAAVITSPTAQTRKPCAVSRKKTSSVCRSVHLVRSLPAR